MVAAVAADLAADRDRPVGARIRRRPPRTDGHSQEQLSETIRAYLGKLDIGRPGCGAAIGGSVAGHNIDGDMAVIEADTGSPALS